MLRMISKIRKICSVTLIPRILRDEWTLSPAKLGKRPFNGFWKMNKSSDSKDKEAECEKCKKIIEKVFGPDKPDPVLKQVEADLEDIHMDKLQKAIAPSIPVKDKLKENDGYVSDVLSVKNQNKDVNVTDNAQAAINNVKDQIALGNTLQATTATENKEELAQKLETIDEPVLVEAASPKPEGFNTPPKVLGDQETIFDSNNSICKRFGLQEEVLDEIAKKCLGSPPDKIDERIIEEIKSYGLSGRGRKKSNRKHGSYMNRPNRRDTVLETKSDESTLYCEKQQKPVDTLHSYPSLESQNMNFTRYLDSIYPAYYKNTLNDTVGDGHSKLNTNEQEKALINQEDGKTEQLSPDNSKLVASYQQIPVFKESTSDSQGEVCVEAVKEKSESLQTVTHEEEKPQESNEKEHDIEEIHVTASEMGRLGIPGKSELEIDFSQKPLKPHISAYNQILGATDTTLSDKWIEADKPECYVSFSKRVPTDWRQVPSDQQQHPDAATSGNYNPQGNWKPEPEVRDTAISAHQNPGEFFELSHYKMEKLDAYAINPLAIRPLEAYHPYTIISGTEEVKDTQSTLLSTKDTVNETAESLQVPLNVLNSETIESQQSTPIAQTPDTPTTLNKDISATIGPLPQMKEVDEELTLSEMLKRVRERNRLQFCRECELKAVQAEPIEANKVGPTTKDPPKVLGPQPCKPKPKPAECPPAPQKCPPPPSCPPPKKKDPCAKFTNSSLIGGKIKEAFVLVLNTSLIPFRGSPTVASDCKVNATEPLKHVRIADAADKAERLGSFLLSNRLKTKSKPEDGEVILAKDYEPWVPIPSWPIPKKEKKRTFVCPKEGCKVLPPPGRDPPCKEKPCATMPKRTFSLAQFDFEPLYLYDYEL